MGSAVIEHNDEPERQLPATQPDASGTVSLMRVIERAAADPNFDVARLQQLLDVKERWDKEEARKAFHAAMARFKKNPPQIVKDAHVYFESRNGGSATEYDHASLGAVCDAIIAGLAEVGISHNWDPAQKDNGWVEITCVLTHELGHSTKTPLFGPPDKSGNKNDLQAIASTSTLLSRYTLLLATGLATKAAMRDARMIDDDGRGGPDEPPPGDPPPSQFISEKQVADLEALISEVGANKEAFLRVLKVERLEDLPVSRFDGAIQRLNEKAKGVRK